MTKDEINEIIQVIADEFKANWDDYTRDDPPSTENTDHMDVLVVFRTWLQEYEEAVG